MHHGAFTSVLSEDFQVNLPPSPGVLFSKNIVIGIRICPDIQCRGIVFVAMTEDDSVVCLPPEIMDFDPVDIPTEIAATLEEAIKCHSLQCYKASALMIRRVLEEICKERGVNGKNLKDRLKALEGQIVLPTELLSAANDLRLLGNDAAHVEATNYDDVGKEEVTFALELAKEFLKAIYQYKSLISKLKSLRSRSESSLSPASTPSG